jgi:hypothetical protein
LQIHRLKAQSDIFTQPDVQHAADAETSVAGEISLFTHDFFAVEVGDIQAADDPQLDLCAGWAINNAKSTTSMRLILFMTPSAKHEKFFIKPLDRNE